MTDETTFAAQPMEWQEGTAVRWRDAPDTIGVIVHAPEDDNILMVTTLYEEDGEWWSTGVTRTAGYQDVVELEEQPDMENVNMGSGERGDSSFSADPVDYSMPDQDDKYAINVEFNSPAQSALGDGFNKYGVRENEDGSVDVRFNAMEPGERKGYDITSEFLDNVTSKNYGKLPVQMDHSDSQRANVGYLSGDNVKFADGFARMQIHIPNTGSSIRNDVIADFTHEPPAIQDVSIGFEPDSVEVEAPAGRDGNPEFTDARIKELSLTPFPAGYENGGLTPAFSDAIESEIDSGSESEAAESHLVTRQYEIK